jgi:hypothetical protein
MRSTASAPDIPTRIPACAAAVDTPIGLGRNVLGVLVQVQLRMVQFFESNGSVFSGDVWLEFTKGNEFSLPSCETKELL